MTRPQPTHHLQIGDIMIAEDDAIISTVLGSCISVCLYSRQHRAGAINHFALPIFSNGSDTSHQNDDFRYGDQSLSVMIAQFLAVTGATAKQIEAKIIGGASVLLKNEASQSVGPTNIAIARKILKEKGIRVVGEDVGGNHGRKVLFHTATGRVQVANIHENRVQPNQINHAHPAKQDPKPVHAQQNRTFADRAKQIPRVLIVDDSKTIRDLLSRILAEGGEIEVIGVAENPVVAEKMILDLKPDVVTLDIHMPIMDGITFLESFLPKHPLPFVLISSMSIEEGGEVLRGLELGAVDYIQKPTLQTLPVVAPLIREKVKDAAVARVRRQTQVPVKSKMTTSFGGPLNQHFILAIGASTGGTEAIREVLMRLPAGIPPTVIVQHIPPVFSKAFADRLNSLCSFRVKEAEDGDLLQSDQALVAPGGSQMRIEASKSGYCVRITDDAPVNRHKPSVDYLFDSVASLIGRKAVGVILTGMGADGAKGLLNMKNAGAKTIGQDEDSSVVYGMPKAAYDLGAVETVCPLESVSDHILKHLMLAKIAS